MSKIEKNLLDIDIKPKRNEDRQDFLRRAVKEVTSLPDKDWDELEPETQDWANTQADAINAGAKTVADFPDLKPAEPETSGRRRSTARDDDKGAITGTKEIDPAKAKVKTALKVVTKRGKELSGVVVEVDKDVLVLKLGNGDEEELDISRIEKAYVLDTDGAGDGDAADPIKVGATVTVVTKRGKEITGKITELDDEVMVLKTADGEEEVDRSRVESVKVASSGEGRSAGRRASGAQAEPPEDKKTRSSNAGVSVGQRIKELIAEDLEATIEDIDKQLTKEGLEYKDSSLRMNYTDCHKFLDALRAAKRLKG